MKAVILAGGLGTRIAEESDARPKPMVEIGGMPIIWHIMRHYARHGVTEFIICLGYKGYVLKEYFYNYYRHTSDFQVDLGTGNHRILDSSSENWSITFVETGLNTMTGGRLKRVAKYLDDEPFCLTYGDGLSDINISEEIEFHKAHGLDATVAAVQPPGRFAVLDIKHDFSVTKFQEKPKDEVGWINGGFFVLNPSVISRISDDASVWEQEPLISLAEEGKLMAFKHEGFWQPMDTLRDKRLLEGLWQSGNAPWDQPLK